MLLNQFHDVLPGTSIGCVYEDVFRLYGETEEICEQIINDSLSTIIDCGRGLSWTVSILQYWEWRESDQNRYRCIDRCVGCYRDCLIDWSIDLRVDTLKDTMIG